MSANPYLSKYPQDEVELLTKLGFINPDIDDNANLIIERSENSMYSSSITIPLKNTPFDSVKVETAYNVQFTEL